MLFALLGQSVKLTTVSRQAPRGRLPGPEVIKKNFILSSAETKIYSAHKC